MLFVSGVLPAGAGGGVPGAVSFVVKNGGQRAGDGALCRCLGEKKTEEKRELLFNMMICIEK
ncbi:MAG: hypothetical protein Q4A62_02930 [Eikenella sp.]|nr:hypothetical protein [Eikenella sp.]